MSKRGFIIINMLVLIMLVALTVGCVENIDKDEIILTVTFNDYNAKYSLKDLESIQSYTDTGRYIKTKLLPDSIVLSNSLSFTGVRMYKILEDIPNLPDNYNISVISSDDWTVTYTIDDINGKVDVYDEEGNIIPNHDAIMILAYKEDGKYYSEIDPEGEIGPLRVAFVDDNIITSSNLWSKMVVSIEIITI